MFFWDKFEFLWFFTVYGFNDKPAAGEFLKLRIELGNFANQVE